MSQERRTPRIPDVANSHSPKRAIERSVDEELAFHIAQKADDLVRSGWTRTAAEREARLQFGDMDAARIELTDIDSRRVARVSRLRWWSDLLQDTRVALRSLSTQRGFTAVVLLTMALGIGANGAVYTVVDAALLRPLPYRAPDQLVHLWQTKEGWDDQSEASFPDFEDWRAQNSTFQALEGYDETNVTIGGAGEPFRSQGVRVTSGMIAMLGGTPLLGRTFVPGEDGPNGSPVVILSHGFWQRRFNEERDVVGRSITIDGVARTIVGVLPPGFTFALVGESELWLPIDRSAETRAQRFNHWLRVVGRLKDGVTIEQARSDVGTVMSRLAAQHPATNAGRGIAIVPLREEIVGSVRPTLLTLFGAVALLLLISCANVASLLLARAMTRGREMAVRVALGASRSRLVRQLLTESALLSVAGGALGVWLAHVATRLLISALPENIRLSRPYLTDLSVDAGVLAYLAAVALLTGAAFGLFPALYASRPTLGTLISGDRRATGGAARTRLRGLLVTFEIALTVVLLIGAGLLTRSLSSLLRVDAGFDPSRTVVLRVALAGTYSEAAAQQNFFETLITRARAIPGVSVVGAVSQLPLNGGGTNTFRVAGQPEPDPARRPEAVSRGVAGDYFRALGIPLLDGRVFDARDDSSATQVILVSESIARRFFPGKSAVGEKLVFYAWGSSAWTIIGVVGDVKTTRLDAAAPPTVYYSHLQGAENRMTLTVKSSNEPTAVVSAVREIVRSMDSQLPVYAVRTMEREISDSPAVYSRRYPLMLLGTFAVTALILSIVGIVGVISFSVAQRTREIGIRVALGAARRAIFAMVLREGAKLAITGLVVGVAVALMLTHLLETLLFGVGAADPFTYAAIAALILCVAGAASYLPARRATRVDPATVLRLD